MQDDRQRRIKASWLQYVIVDLGMVEILEDITPPIWEKLKINLLRSGLELLDDKKVS
jgi:hypothetical protein